MRKGMFVRLKRACTANPQAFVVFHMLAPTKDPDGEQYNEQQEVTCTATGGSFTLTFRGFTTGAIDYSASAEDVADALKSLPSLYGSYDTPVSVQFSSVDIEVCERVMIAFA